MTVSLTNTVSISLLTESRLTSRLDSSNSKESILEINSSELDPTLLLLEYSMYPKATLVIIER